MRRAISSRDGSASHHPAATAAYKHGTRKRSSDPARHFRPRALTKDNQAKAHHYGLGDTLQNEDRAIALYEQAVRLGARAPDAYVELAELYDRRGDADEGLRLLTRGAEGGVVECWDTLAAIYMRAYIGFHTPPHPDNARKSFRQFFACVKPVNSSPAAFHLWRSLGRYIELCAGHADAADTAVIGAFGNDFAQVLNRLPNEAARRARLGELRDLTPQFHDLVDAILAAPAPSVAGASPISLGELRDLVASLGALAPRPVAGASASIAHRSSPSPAVWAAVKAKADTYMGGEGDCIQDYEEALRLYEQAASLGCGLAYRRIGFMYACGLGVPPDEATAISVYAEGIRKCAYQCYPPLAAHFKKQQDEESAARCWRTYSQYIAVQLASEPPSLEDAVDIFDYLFPTVIKGDAILIDKAIISAFRSLLAIRVSVGHPMKGLLDLLEEFGRPQEAARKKQQLELQSFIEWLEAIE